ncbi:MAG: hypothetical protein JOY58_06575 [Solirubrobacterales bacterium]|nr:hypothetical protein [Solirubrobacterales bacterium]MBV9047914.1 hypothetical protein [Solirubrobacterales bacterium]
MNRRSNQNIPRGVGPALAAAFAGLTATWPVSTASHLELAASLGAAAILSALLGK